MNNNDGRQHNHPWKLTLLVALGILFILGISLNCQLTRPVINPPTGTATASPTASSTYTPTITRTPTPTQPPPTSTLGNISPSELFTLGRGSISDVTRSPDGQLVAVLENGYLKWFSSETYEQLGEIFVDEYAGGIIFNSDGRLAIVDTPFGGVLIDLQQQNQIAQLGGGDFTFSRDSEYIAIGASDQTTGGYYDYIKLWDVGREEIVYRSLPTLLEFRIHGMSRPAISPDSRLVAAGHSDSRVYVWNIENGETRFILEGHARMVNSVDFSPDGRYLASGSADGTVRLWNPDDGRLVRVITGFLDSITGVEFSADSRVLRVNVDKQPDQSYDLTSGQLSAWQEAAATPDPFTSMLLAEGYLEGRYPLTRAVFSPVGNYLAVARDSVQIWDVSTQQLVIAFDVPLSVKGMGYSPDGERLGVINTAGDVQVWETAGGSLSLSLTVERGSDGQPYYVSGQTPGIGISIGSVLMDEFAFSPDGDRLAVGIGAEGAIWDIQNAERLITLERIQPLADITRLSYSADGQRLYGALNRNRGAAIWDANTGRLISRFDLTSLNPSAFSTNDLNGPMFVRNNYDEHSYWIEIWNLDEQNFIRVDSPGRETSPLQLSPDGSLLFATNDYRLFAWMSDDGALIYRSVTRDFELEELAINQDNTLMALSTHDHVVVWDTNGIANRALAEFVPTVVPLPTATESYSWPTSTPMPPVSITPIPLPPLAERAISPEQAAQVVELARFGAGRIEQVSWAEDSRSVTVTGSLGVDQYSLQAEDEFGEPVHYPSDLWVSSTVRLADGRSLAAGTDGERVRVWDLDSGERLVDLEGGGEPALSPDGRLLVFLGGDRNLHTWDVQIGQPVANLLSYWLSPAAPIFSPDSRLVAAVVGRYSRSSSQSVRVWDANSGVIVNALGGPDNAITDLAFSLDGRRVTAAAGGSAWVWDIRPGQAVVSTNLYEGVIDNNLTLYEQTVTAAALSPDNRTLAVGTSENTIGLYALGSQTPTHQLVGHAAAIEKLAFSPNGRYLLSVDADGAMSLWNASSGELLQVVDTYHGAIRGLVFQENEMLIGWGNGTTWRVDPAEGELLHTTQITSGTILAVSPQGDWLAATYPYQVSLYDAVTGEFRQTLEGEAPKPFVEYYWEGQMFQGYHGAAFSPDGSVLVTLGSGGASIYNTQDGSLVRSIEGDNAQQADISTDNRWLLSALRIQANPPAMYDLQSGENVFWLEGWGYTNIQYKISPDNRWVGVAARNEDGYQFQLWDFASHTIFQSLDFSPEIPLLSLAFSPDARLVALGQADGQIFLMDLSTFQVVATLTGHRGAVERLAFSPSGRYLASGGQDGTIRIWGVP